MWSSSQSLLAALGSVQFISNVGFAYFVLGENVTNRCASPSLVQWTVLQVLFQAGIASLWGNHLDRIQLLSVLLERNSSHSCIGKSVCKCVERKVCHHHQKILEAQHVIGCPVFFAENGRASLLPAGVRLSSLQLFHSLKTRSIHRLEVSASVFSRPLTPRSICRASRILLATAFIVIGNIFLVAFGNHESKSK